MKELKRFILLALLKAGGIPMSDENLMRVCRGAFTPVPLMTDIERGIKALEESRLISGNNDPIDGTTWALTDAGMHRAKQL